MRAANGITIESVSAGGRAAEAGLCPGDVILSVNGHPMRDPIDFMFNRTGDDMEVRFRRQGRIQKTLVSDDGAGELGVTFRPFPVRTCGNNCIFCFVKQLPKGLRRSLYVKDEDYRLSFLYGNYVTLSNLAEQDRKRIVEQRLSPLYISVHSTNNALRNTMLGSAKAGDIMKDLRFFAGKKIRMHTQIVLCPGYNDGDELKRTISDLYRLHPYVSSIAVVPVGLTRHRKTPLRPVSQEDAQQTLDIITAFQTRFRKRHGEGIVYAADELYIRADRPFPPVRNYDGLPQIENGVGMVPLFLSQSRRTHAPKEGCEQGRAITFTGVSFYPFLKRFADRLAEKEGVQIEVVPVENRFFGSSVTVTGLLTGRDIIAALHDRGDGHTRLLVPDVVLKDGEHLLLDDVSLDDIREALGIDIVVFDGSPGALVSAACGTGGTTG